MKAKRNTWGVLKKVFGRSRKSEIFEEDVEAAYYGNEQSPRVEHLVERFFQKKGSVLDVGCGSGREAFWLAGRGFTVDGIDVSSGMIAAAEKRRKREKIAGARFAVEDMVRFSSKKKYDYVMALFNVLTFPETEKDRKKALRNMAKALKPGGVLVLDLANKWGNARIVMKQLVFKLLFLLAGKWTKFGDVYSNPTLAESREVTFQHYFSKGEMRRYLAEIPGISYEVEFFDLYRNRRHKNHLLVVVRKRK
ncbi:hypothetical protein CMI48_00225 [Candidatus Pacearchaeota archaeon]|nr:hypothetical protein [Candidatus Pacearchaeota archaeon]